MEIAKIVKEIEKTANETEIQSDCLREQVTQICEWLSEIARKTGQYYLRTRPVADAQQVTIAPSSSSVRSVPDDEPCDVCSA